MSVRKKYETLMQELAAQAAADEQERQRRKAAGIMLADQLRNTLKPDASWLGERGYTLAGDGPHLTITSAQKQISCECDNDAIRLRVLDLTGPKPVVIEHMSATVKSVEAAEEMIADFVRQFGSVPAAAPARRRLFGNW
jgi:hypothetical protein